ncbi:hypothetical protein [Pseudomonas sp. 5P_3.1_Bac2]|uniref:hypothetical protein n=1 Tax=Pseudomonas sp. 5P_3.1_Bac2 TaxID=2971617 RepID=UPI0021C58387|nr:hypothetical protein [Pseudomonas sp. 5P_3.1_Bac2]MCU1715778.1 hypothetical protein [Pseudomonas sp. 5P_3.1_Bac2]
MKPSVLLAASLLCLSLTGCYSFTPSGPLNMPPRFAETTLKRGAMVADVQISDSSLEQGFKRNLSHQLTDQLHERLERGEYFTQVLSFPATLGSQDVLLKFNFTSLKGKRGPHPGYFPGALLTLTIWIWVNGPIYVDSYDLAAELSLVDSQGQELSFSRKQIQYKQNVGLWDPDYLPSTQGREQLNELVEQLLQDATRQLKPH